MILERKVIIFRKKFIINVNLEKNSFDEIKKDLDKLGCRDYQSSQYAPNLGLLSANIDEDKLYEVRGLNYVRNMVVCSFD